MNHQRITRNSTVAGGQPCIRGTDVTVSTILALLAGGAAAERIVAEYPALQVDDVEAALWYAAWRLRESDPDAD